MKRRHLPQLLAMLLSSLVLGISTACTVTPTSTSTCTVWLVDDGCHTGLLVGTPDLKMNGDEAIATPFANASYIEFGFSERGWALGDKQAISRIIEAPFRDHPGVVLAIPFVSLSDAFQGRRAIRYEVESEGLHNMMIRIGDWIARPLDAEPSPLGQSIWLLASNRSYTILRNCRYFTASILRAIDQHILAIDRQHD
jgi:hypothetical protein